jgi:predicted aspartyl protease
MSVAFNPAAGLVLVSAELDGLTATAIVRLALDTGATATLLNVPILVAVGYDPATAPSRVQMTTGSGVEYAARLVVSRLRAMGQERTAFTVLGHTLPPSAGVDGLLGLDFMRG